MTRNDILEATGDALDNLTAHHVMGWHVNPDYLHTREWCRSDGSRTGYNEHHCLDSFEPSHRMAEAWLVFVTANEWLFTARRRFFRELQELTRQPGGALVSWPDVLTVLRHRMPEAICRAALLAKFSGERT